MAPDSSPENLFAKRDIGYLREVQYGSTKNLNARVALHQKYSTAKEEWFAWLTSQVNWPQYHAVLEVGCGTGLLWAHVPADAVSQVDLMVTDLSQSMVDATMAVAQEVVGTAHGCAANVEALPFDDASFDLVLANHMLYHASDPTSAVKELVRVLRPGGVLVASTNGSRHLAELYDIDTAVFGPTGLRNNNAEIFGAESGFAILRDEFDWVEWRGHSDALECTEVDDVVAYLLSVPPGSFATPEQVGQLMSEVSSRMAETNGILRVSKEAGVFLCQLPRASTKTH